MGLSTLGLFAAVAQRRVSGLFATPDLFGPNQNPLGAVLLPQALVSVGPTPSPEGLSLALVGLFFLRLASNSAQPLSSSRNPGL